MFYYFYMNFKYLLPAIVLAVLCLSPVYALGEIKQDSIVSRSSLFIIPHPGYQQETNWSLGIAGGYYFKSNDISKISSISGSADYTLLNQFIFNITPKIYLNDKKWYIYSNLNFRDYPDYFYGIGNTPTAIKQTYTSDLFSLTVQPQYALNRHVLVGGMIGARFESLKTDSSFVTVRDELYSMYGKAGWEPYAEISAGALATYDGRDNQFYPQSGIFAKSTLNFATSVVGETYKSATITLDFRQYIPLLRNHVFAWQIYSTGVFSSTDIPFQLLPTLGGRDMMRGFRQGMYRENLLMSLQTEYRMPIYKRLKAAVFCTTGDVVNTNNFQINKLKVSYGAGLRYRLNDARVHLRVDLAKNNYGEKLQFYITATEAF